MEYNLQENHSLIYYLFLFWNSDWILTEKNIKYLY